MRHWFVTLALLAVTALNAAPQEVFLARNPRVNRFKVNGVRMPGVHSLEQLRDHLAGPAGQNDINLMLGKLNLSAEQKEQCRADIVKRLAEPLNTPGGVWSCRFAKGTEFRRITHGVGTFIDNLTRLGVSAEGYVLNMRYLGVDSLPRLTGLVVFKPCGNMAGTDPVLEEQPPPTPEAPPVGEVSFVPTVVTPPGPADKPVAETSLMPQVATPPQPPHNCPPPQPAQPVKVEIHPVPLPITVERQVAVMNWPLTLNRRTGGSGWVQNAPPTVQVWQRGQVGFAYTWQNGGGSSGGTKPPEICDPNVKPPPAGELPQPDPVTPPPGGDIGSLPANPGGVPTVGDGADGAINTPPATPIGDANGGVVPVPAPGSPDGPPVMP